MGAVEHFQRLVIIPGLGQRAAVGAEHRLVVRLFDRSLLKDGDSLSALSRRAQRLRVAQRYLDVRRIGAILLTQDFDGVPAVGIRRVDRTWANFASRFTTGYGASR